jgi:sec-independent protein translocase protein TatA
MGTFSWVHWLLVAVVVLVLFGGRGKISSLMGDFAQGIKAFKKGMSEDETAKTETPPADPKTINQTVNHPAEAAKPVDPLKQQAQTERKFEGSAG